MSKMASGKQEDENITVSKVYETLRSGPFLQKLYWDVLSDIKEKDTFKQIKETTEKLINKKSEVFDNLSDNDADNLQRKTIVAEICSVTYAVDTVFSKILFIKLQKEFKSYIIDAIKDLRQEKKIPDSVWSKLKIFDDPVVKDSAEKSAVKSNSHQQKPETSSRPMRTKRLKLTPAQLAMKNNELRSEIHEDLKAINSEEGKLDMSRKNLKAGNQAVTKKQTSTAVINMSTKKKGTEEDQTPSKLNTVTKNTEYKDPKEVMQIDDPDSDTESIISVGGVSLESVSSVHTSDLSSYDDEISLSSEEDHGTKKRLSLKELKEMCNSGQLSDKFNGSMVKGMLEQSSQQSTAASNEQQFESSFDKTDNAPDSADSSTESKSQIQKTLPKRVRKPNSRYLSDNILCTVTKVKERKKQPNVENEIKSSDASQLNRKRARNDALDSEETPVKIFKTVSVTENEIKTELSPSNQYNSSESCKPHFPVHSLTSRKFAPLTLYST